MPRIDLSTTAITAFLQSLPKAVLDTAAPTHLPISLPLAFPTPLHQINFVCTVHLTLALLSRPEHSIYFSEEPSLSPRDMALRGCLGLYLASDPEWNKKNLLSAHSWGAGSIDEAKVCEFFGIKIMREKAHESMPGITVGERWGPGSSLATELVNVFKRDWHTSAQCYGEELQTILFECGKATTLETVQLFCEKVAALESFEKSSHHVSGTVLPAIPLRLLQDLAYLNKLSPETLSTPSYDELVNLSPFPLPIPLLLYLGIYDLSDSDVEELDALRKDVGTWWKHDVDLFAAATRKGTTTKPVTSITISHDTYNLLADAAVEACREIWNHSRFLAPSSESESWRKDLTLADISRVCESLEAVMEREGLGVRLVLDQSTM